MKKGIKLLLVVASFAAIALGVYIAGETALSSSPIMALIPVAVLLVIIVFYIRYQDKQ